MWNVNEDKIQFNPYLWQCILPTNILQMFGYRFVVIACQLCRQWIRHDAILVLNGTFVLLVSRYSCVVWVDRRRRRFHLKKNFCFFDQSRLRVMRTFHSTRVSSKQNKANDTARSTKYRISVNDFDQAAQLHEWNQSLINYYKYINNTKRMTPCARVNSPLRLVLKLNSIVRPYLACRNLVHKSNSVPSNFERFELCALCWVYVSRLTIANYCEKIKTSQIMRQTSDDTNASNV